MEEVQGQASDAPLRKSRVSVKADNMQEVRNLCQRMPPEIKAEFRNQYGKIMSLLNISVDGNVLSALTQFWNRDLHCFELPELDTVPTVEEYEAMLCMPIRESAGPYIYQGYLAGMTGVMSFLDMPSDCMSKSACNLKKVKVVKYLKQLFEQERWDLFKKTLALIIFGMVLFPYDQDHISQESTDVYLQYEHNRASPVPAILAETLLSVNFCHGKKKGSLRCCLHLLYVWIITHCYAKRHMGDIPDPFYDFQKIPKKELTLAEWGNEFGKMKALQYTWVCPWFRPESVITSCGDFPYVPLMGSRGCITYTPALVFRQYRRTQVQPATEQLKSWHFKYTEVNTENQQVQVRKAWGFIHRKGIEELGGPHITSSREYKDWRRARNVPTYIPNEILQEGETSQSASNTSLDVSNLISQMERLKAQVTSLEKEDKAKKERIKQLISEARRKDTKIGEQVEKIKTLDQECATYVGLKRARSGKGVASVSINERKLQEQVEEQQGAIAYITQEKENLEASIQFQMQHNDSLKRKLGYLQEYTEDVEKKLLDAKHDACRGWEVSREYYYSMMEANQNMEQLKKEVEELTKEGEQLRISLDNNSEDAKFAVSEWQKMRRTLETEKDHFAYQILRVSQDLRVHSYRWVRLFDRAAHETRTVYPAIFPEMERFLEFSSKVADVFRGMGGTGLEAPPASPNPPAPRS